MSLTLRCTTLLVLNELVDKINYAGNICVRGFDRRSRAPKPLGRRFHTPPSKMGKPFKKWHDDE